MIQTLFGAKAQVVLGGILTGAAIVGWPATAATIFKHEPQGILGLSWCALILTGYNLIATGLGYRATERVETVLIDTVEQMDVDVDVERAS